MIMNAHAAPIACDEPRACELGLDGYALGDHWYVVEAFEHSVENAYLRLAVAGLRVWMPVDMKRRAKRFGAAARRDRPQPRFGRFFFVRCRMDAGLQHAISVTPSIVGLLLAAGSDRPSPIPDYVIDWIGKNPVKQESAAPFGYAPGDVVRILAGPFASFQGPVEDVDKRGVLRVCIDIFGRPTPVVVEAGHVEMVLKAKSRAISTFKHSGEAIASRRVR